MQDNSANNKRIAKNTLLLYVRMLLMMGINLYTSRAVLDILGVSDFGLYNVVGGFVSMFTIISGAMTTATQRFLSFEIGKGKDGNVRSLFSTAVLIHISLAIIIFVLGESVGVWFLNTQMKFPLERCVAANWVFQLSLITFMVNVISVPYNAALVAYERMSAFAYVSILEAILKLIVVFLLLCSPFDKLIVYALFLALIAITIRVVYGIYCSKNFKECRCNWTWDAEHRSKMASFVNWNLIGSLAGVAKEQGLNVMLNAFFGTTVNAAKGLTTQVNNAIHGFVTNFQLAMNPQIVKSYASKEIDSMYGLVFRGSKFSFFLFLMLSLPVILETPYILHLWLKIVPEHTVWFLRVVLITGIVSSLSGTLITAMHASGKVKEYQIVVGGLSLLTLPIAYIALKTGLQPISVFIVALGIEILCHFMRVYMLNKTIGFPARKYLYKVTLKVFCTAIMSLPVPLLIHAYVSHGVLSFICVCFVSLISVVICCYYIGMEKSEQQFFAVKINQFILKYTHNNA